MSLKDIIELTEQKYLECFSEKVENSNFIRFRDSLLPGMYAFNCTIIKDAGLACLEEVVKSEIKYSKDEGKDFCQIYMQFTTENIFDEKKEYEATAMGYYALDFDAFFAPKIMPDCDILRLDTPKMAQDMLLHDLEVDGEFIGEDFCTKRAKRRSDVYLSNIGLERYLCYSNNEIIGKCELFMCEGSAKIEDLEISPRYYHKGYGHALLSEVIRIAQCRGAKTIYLATDEADTPKEMYKKMGFFRAHESTELLLKF